MIHFKKPLFLLFLFIYLTGKCQTVETITYKEKNRNPLQNWELFLIQNPASTFENTKPLVVAKSKQYADSINLDSFKGVCWYRKVIKPDTSFENKNVSLCMSLVGAAEIYVNRKLVKEVGTVGVSDEMEESVSSTQEYVGVKFDPGKEYEILVRYSNHILKGSYDSRGHRVFGIEMYVTGTDYFHSETISELVSETSFGVLLLAFFSTVGFIHLLIYLFNRNEISNFYYSLVCFFAAGFTFSNLIESFTDSALFVSYTSLVGILMLGFVFVTLPYMFRSFFKLKRPKWYRLIFLNGVLCTITIISNFYYGLFFIALVIIGAEESIRAIIIAIREKKPGVKILGIGLSLFVILLLLVLASAIFGAQFTTGDELTGMLLLGFLILSVTSIPISISVFLAYSISLTNKSLAKKLVEVEELSAKSLEQEKEKQAILSNQNEMLEKQVNERTAEIKSQKKVIEEKNKDIIDSINYAKRLQNAMLPSERAFKEVFQNSFVLYQPRDIVSGDFYFVCQVNDKKLVVAADCTGHGVPGALMSMVGSNILHKLCQENEILEPKKLLETLHVQLRHALKQDVEGSENRDGMDASAMLINENEIKIGSANRPVIYFDKNNSLHEIKASKTPIGGSHIPSIEITEHTLNKSEVETIYLFSDGFADQFGGQSGKKLMVSRFKQWLQELTTQDVSLQKDELLKRFNDWKNSNEQVDDVMVIGVKP